jgi:hypothetical protein
LRSEEPGEEAEEDDEDGKLQTGQAELPPIEETEENIDQTRFTD